MSECKSGPTYPGYLRLDGWAMKKSWASPMVSGYEIKVSRGDFLADTKYLEYAEYCNALYLVAPKGIIEPEELPEGVGYYQVASTGTRLYCKRKAVPRTDPIPEEIYRYILMARARIVSPYEQFNKESKSAFFSSWLEARKVDRELGARVSKTLSARIDQEIDLVRRENARLKHENEKFEELRMICKDLGVDPGHVWVDEFRRKLGQRLKGSKPAITFNLKNALESLNYMSGLIEEVE